MTKKRNIILQAILCIYLVAYMIALIHKSDFWGNILSQIGAFIAAAILFSTYKKVEKFRVSWLLAGLACLAWGVTDTLWAVFYFFTTLDPDNMDLFMYMYLMPNFLLATAVCSFFYLQWRRWNRIQMILDLLAIIATVLSLMWILFFDKQFELLLKMSTDSFTTFLYIFSDLFSVSLVITLYISNRSRNLPAPFFIAVAGIVTYTAADLYYTYQIFHNIYEPNSLTDGIYMAALLIIATAGIWIVGVPIRVRTYTQFSIPDNIGSNRKILILLFAPVIVAVIKGFNASELLILFTIILLHQAFSGYIQGAIKNERLLRQEKMMNENLERSIEEHTRELTAANLHLDRLSNLDAVTELYNRRFFIKEFDRIIESAEPGEQVILFYMDLDQFKTINDSYGHDTGDEVLIELANRLKAWKPKNALLARLGGDEFVLVYKGRYKNTEIENTAKQIHKLCSIPIILNPYRFQLSMSIGITVCPKDAKERNALMRNADIAMYHAKSQGFNKYAFFDPSLSDRISRRNELELLLRKVNFDQEFELYYQPQFSIPEHRLTGMEALLRWKSPELGMIPPDEFIPIAEEIGKIVPIGEWVMMHAIRQISTWNNQYAVKLKMGINISAKQLDSLNFLSTLQSLIRAYGIEPDWLDAEITEGNAMKSEVSSEAIFQAIKVTGSTISIDDFGTGYSSLSYIKRFAINRLKIAKTLIDNISTDHSERQIVQAIVLMAKAMNIRTIAEGVEREDQLKILTELGCDEVQGYVFSRPLPADEFEKRYLKNDINS